MFNLGFGEIVVIGIIALIFIGPKQLPDVARAVARFLNELKRAGSEATSALMNVQDEANSYINKVIQDPPPALPPHNADSSTNPSAPDSQTPPTKPTV